MEVVVACFRPIDAWLPVSGGSPFFYEVPDSRYVQLPCSQCVGCRLARARSWALRCMHESQCHFVNSFVTLTYNDSCLPFDCGLHYRDFQLFVKRLRKSFGKCRYFVCGEYGDRFRRPHFHALLFGFRPIDLKEAGTDLYSSEVLDSLWRYGSTRVGSVSFASAGYVAKYCLKKVGARVHTERYRRVDVDTGEVFNVAPEMAHMSRRPGLGYVWYQRYWRDVYKARDGVCMPGGSVLPAPKYYDRLLLESCPDLREEKDLERYVHSMAFKEDCTPERLAVRELCAQAKVCSRVRSVE